MRTFLHKIKETLVRYEGLIFFIVAVINLFPLFSRQFFPFMDAPAHLYNAKLINQMVFGHNEFLREYFAFNPVIVPNWMSHIIMSPLHGFFEPGNVEKIYLISYFFLFPYALRYCVMGMNRENKYIAYLGFPLAYNTLAMYSFFNFSYGLVFFLLCVGYFYRHHAFGKATWKHYLGLFILLLCVYLCHLVVLMITLLCMAFMFLNALWLDRPSFFKKLFSVRTALLIVVSLPSLVLLLLYLKAFHTSAGTYEFLEKRELLEYLLNGRHFISFGFAENYNSGLLAFLIFCLFLPALYFVLCEAKQHFFASSRLFLGAILVAVLGLYFYLPNSDGVGGYVSIRLCILIFIIVVLFSSAFRHNRVFLGCVLFISLYIQHNRLKLYNEIIVSRNRAVTEIRDQAVFVEPNSFLFSFKIDDDWLSGHQYNYLCLDKPVVAVQDYECMTGYFPLVWKSNMLFATLNEDLHTFSNFERVKEVTHNRPIYYWVLGSLEQQTEPVKALKINLEKHCILLNSNNFASLYKLR